MSSTAGVIFLVVGIVIGLLGGFLWIDNEEDHENCKFEMVRYLGGDRCFEADRNYFLGIAGMGVGGILAFIGIMLIAVGLSKPTSPHLQFTCSRCQASLTYQYSPTNCYNCGLPVNWSMEQMPKK